MKDDAELKAIAAAARLADEVYLFATERGLRGRTEADVAAAAVARMRELGAEPSFPPIIAAGPNGALPHAEPGEREIGAAELVVFDMGAELDGYCSDCTRTFSTGEIGGVAGEVYELVLSAQQAALEAVEAGVEDGRSTRSPARSSTPPATAIDSATASDTESGWRSTRRRAFRPAPMMCSRRGRW